MVLVHPVDVGYVTTGRSREGLAPGTLCEVIEREQRGRRWFYYLHYRGYDRRLDEWVPQQQLPEPDEGSAASGALLAKADDFGRRRATRNMKRKIDEIHNKQDMSATDEALEKEHEESTKVKNIQMIEMGRYEVDAWYFSPYPDAFAQQNKLYVCEYTLKYMKRRSAYERHRAGLKQSAKRPPGKLIYTDAAPPLSSSCVEQGMVQPKQLTCFEVDGSNSKVYCQCLCLLAKLFLDHKTLYYDVEPFLFYVLCEADGEGGHSLVGYFSKEKASVERNNIACILVLPQHQRKGYGKLLIDLAYTITLREGGVGSPEKPLSDLGQLSFRSYWTDVLLDALASSRGNLSIAELSVRTAIKRDDIIATLQSLNLIKFWKGQHVISVSAKIVDEHLRANARPSLRCDAAKLTWQPPPPQKAT